MQLSDVTLREADQMPGRSYTVEQKVQAGQALDRLGVGTIQAGFPATGAKDSKAVSQLSETVDADVCAIARAVESDIQTAISADADIVQIFAPVSDLQLESVLGKSRTEMMSIARDAIDYAHDHGTTVEFGLMDGFRTDREHIVDIVETFSDVSSFLLADTVGSRTPGYVTTVLTALENDGIDLSRIGVHFHDDLGLATANALTAVELGVEKVDVSVASLGERAGNTALEQLVVSSVIANDDPLGTQKSELIPICNEVLGILDEDIHSRTPILGEEVSEHESGLHTSVMLDTPEAFEPFDPSEFGGNRELIFGEGTGKAAARRLLERRNRTPTEERVNRLLETLATEGPVTLSPALEIAERV